MENKLIKKDDSEELAFELIAPISLLIGAADRQPEMLGAVLQRIEKHIDRFIRLYQHLPQTKKEGGLQMNVNYEQKEAMTFIGYHTEIRPEEGYRKCPEFWDREYAAKYAKLWQTMTPETELEKAILENGIGMFAICAESKNGFDYWIAGLYKGGNVPEGLELYNFPAGGWAVFSAKGAIPESLQTLNTAVWQEWFPTEGKKYQANGSATLEVYSAGNPQSPDYECGIWVPIQKKIEA